MTKVNYGTGLCAVTGNVIRGAGTDRGVGLYYSTGATRNPLQVTSTGNAVVNVHVRRHVGRGVPLLGDV